MATTTEGNIAEALFKRLSTLSLSPALPIAWQNVNYTPPASGKYLEASFIPNGNERQHIESDGAHRHIGILQVSVHWPHGGGAVAPTEIAGAIANHFPADLTLTEGGVAVRITKRPDVAGALSEDAGSIVPLTIEYEAFIFG